MKNVKEINVEGERVVLDDVIEYDDNYPVELALEKGKYVVVSYNQMKFDCTTIDARMLKKSLNEIDWL